LLDQATILLADDHSVVRSGFRYLLEGAGYKVSEADSAEMAYQLYQKKSHNVVIMDISMPGMGGLEGIRRLIARYPEVCILVLSMYDDQSYQQSTFDLGVKAYLTKNCASNELVMAVKSLLQGDYYPAKSIKNQAISKNKLITFNLSSRQFQVFRMLADGQSSMDISKELNLSHKTINNHRSSIMKILKLKNNVELSRFAIRHGVIEP
jgi:two-component system, NarL family, invasion response regulator UvrY